MYIYILDFRSENSLIWHLSLIPESIFYLQLRRVFLDLLFLDLLFLDLLFRLYPPDIDESPLEELGADSIDGVDDNLDELRLLDEL